MLRALPEPQNGKARIFWEKTRKDKRYIKSIINTVWRLTATLLYLIQLWLYKVLLFRYLSAIYRRWKQVFGVEVF